jgi:hypothetical protein
MLGLRRMSEPRTARFQDIPVPRRDIVAALLGELDEQVRAKVEAICQLLVRVHHFEFHVELEALKHAYAPFNPDLERFDRSDPPTPARAQVLERQLEVVLERGNYERLTEADLTHAFSERSLFPLDVNVDTTVYDKAMFYARGETVRTAVIPRWYGLRRRTVSVPTFDRVCLFVRFKPDDQLQAAASKSRRRLRRRRRHKGFEPGTTILKLFRNIPKADLEILYPNCQPGMRTLDRLFFGVPALLGGIPVLAKLVPATFALAVLLGFRRGHIDTTSIIAGLTGVIVLGGYLGQQWIKFKNRRLLFSKELSENLYFRNLDNNEGVLTRLVDEAEDEENKETILAYYLLLRAPEGLSARELGRAIETWLAEHFDVALDFEIADAIGKLERLSLATLVDGQARALAPADALERLRGHWDVLIERALALAPGPSARD